MVYGAKAVQPEDGPSAMASIPDGKPLTGKPDAGNRPVRFGGRGKVNPLSLPLFPPVPGRVRPTIDNLYSYNCRLSDRPFHAVRNGGGGRNRTRPAFHKPLEINCLNHHRCLDNKGVCDLSQVNSGRLFLTSFYSPPMRFAGTSAGTFYFVTGVVTESSFITLASLPPLKKS
jgi:hypothetical protein